MRIFLTGATGFVGSQVARDCVSRRHEVSALVRSTSSSGFLKKLGVKLISGDLAGNHRISLTLPECDVVIHIAGIIKAKTIQDFYRVHVAGTRWLLEQLRYQNPNKFIYVSSIAARGPNRDAHVEDSRGPVSHYGKSKVEGEEVVLEYQKHFPVCLVRPPIVYGPWDKETLLLFKFFRRGFFPMVGKVPLKTSFVHVRDLSAQIIAMAEHPGSLKAGPYYPDDGKGGHVLDEVLALATTIFSKKPKKIVIPVGVGKMAAWLIEGIADLMGFNPLIKMDKFQEMSHPFWFCSQDSLQKDFGISPTISLREGLEETKKWYEKEGWL